MKLIRSSTDSVSRLVNEKVNVVETVNASPLRRHFDNVTKPPSPSGGMRKVGIALVATPDPFTSVSGVVLLASSFVMRRREPTSLGSLAQETRKELSEPFRNQDLSIPRARWVGPMEIKPSKGVKVVVNAQREAVFGDESVSIRKISLNDGPRVGEMTGLTLAGFCEVEMPKLDGKKHWYPISDLVGEHGETVVEEEIAIEEEDAGEPEAE
jgi:hypothetical protein